MNKNIIFKTRHMNIKKFITIHKVKRKGSEKYCQCKVSWSRARPKATILTHLWLTRLCCNIHVHAYINSNLIQNRKLKYKFFLSLNCVFASLYLKHQPFILNNIWYNRWHCNWLGFIHHKTIDYYTLNILMNQMLKAILFTYISFRYTDTHVYKHIHTHTYV